MIKGKIVIFLFECNTPKVSLLLNYLISKAKIKWNCLSIIENKLSSYF